MASILFVEDDPEIGALVSRYLGENSFEVTVVQNGESMDKSLKSRSFGMLLLDVGLSGEDGFSICRRIRSTSTIPIIMVTAKTEDVDRIVGLECGADDYIVKPFNPREMLARIKSLFRRVELDYVSGKKPEKRFFSFNGWILDLSSRRVTSPSGATVILTTGEFDLLRAMCEQPNRILSREALLTMTHGSVDGPFDRSIDVLVSRLRTKFSNAEFGWNCIQTIRAEGYVFSAEVSHE